MEGETPRALIKGVLQTSQTTRSSPRLAQTATRERPSRSLTQSSRKPKSLTKVLSSATKRPATQGLLKSNAKRRRSVTSTPSETVTPRTNIRAYLAAADTKSPAKIAKTTTANQRLSQSVVNDRQVLMTSESSAQQKSRPRTRLSQSLPTPSENITPRAAIQGYLNAVNTVPKKNRTTSKQDEKRKSESGEESAEDGEERIQSGVEAVESGDESSERGDKNVESSDEKDKHADKYGDEKEGSEKEDFQNDTREHGNESDEQQELEDAPVEREDKYESSREATAESSQDEEEMSGEGGDKLNSSQEESSQENDSVSKFAGGDPTQGGESLRAASDLERSGVSKSVAWGELRTPVLPTTTKVKATPIVPGKPTAKQKKASEVKKAARKTNQAKKTTRKDSSLLRLPSSLVNGIFRHFSALRVSKDALDAVHVGSDAFFEHVTEDLFSYSKHAGRKTIEESDVELLMRRQGLVKSRESFHALIEKYLPMEYRQEIIPTAKSGNKVVPKAKT
ncbi:centromere protein T-like [Dendronephthya gigantea]|uniref:centromere protein T-like n=1 Tax=Dendronephthya gigantea TaxID=151771 RepID=UPI00106922FA|nr:centromere protein T-like [Dendronephthya gigantea]